MTTEQGAAVASAHGRDGTMDELRPRDDRELLLAIYWDVRAIKDRLQEVRDAYSDLAERVATLERFRAQVLVVVGPAWVLTCAVLSGLVGWLLHVAGGR